MADKKTESAETPVSVDLKTLETILKAIAQSNNESLKELGATISQSTKASIEATAAPRQMTLEERRRKGIGRKYVQEDALDAHFYQNGYEMRATSLFPEEVEALNDLAAQVPAGEYCNKFFTIEIGDRGDGKKEIKIKYPDKTVADKFEQKKYGVNLTQTLRTIIADSKVQAKDRLVRLGQEIKAAQAAVESLQKQ